MRRQPSMAPGGGLSWFLIFYLLMLFSMLLAVHELQPEREGPASLATDC